MPFWAMYATGPLPVTVLFVIDTFVPALAEAEQKLAKGRDELAKSQQQVHDQEKRLQEDVQRLATELKQVESQLPGDFREAYQRIVKSKGPDAMAQVDGESCGGCNHHITSNLISSLMMNRVICCQSCGRMLYLPEDRAPGRP